MLGIGREPKMIIIHPEHQQLCKEPKKIQDPVDNGKVGTQQQFHHQQQHPPTGFFRWKI
jgi:hypothetical protein